MRALITGARGFVGPHLRAHLEAEGDEVVGTDRPDGPDLLDGEALTRFVRDVAPDAVYHLAGASDVGASWAHPLETFRANAEGTLNTMLACVEAGVGRVLAVSSADVYGKVAPEELPLDEHAELRPVTPYAASKVAADHVALQAWLGYGLPVIRARAFNHLGPGQTNRFVAPALAERIARNERSGETSVPVGNLTPRRDFTDVRDVVRAYRALVESGTPGEAYNVCSGVALPISDLADQLLSLAQRPMRLEADPELQRPVETPVLCGDPSKITTATGWRATIPLTRTLADLLDEWRQRIA